MLTQIAIMRNLHLSESRINDLKIRVFIFTIANQICVRSVTNIKGPNHPFVDTITCLVMVMGVAYGLICLFYAMILPKTLVMSK